MEIVQWAQAFFYFFNKSNCIKKKKLYKVREAYLKKYKYFLLLFTWQKIKSKKSKS